MDVARTVIRHGAREVTLYARGLASNASEHETAYARLDGAAFEFGKQIAEITDDGPVFENILYDAEGNQTGVNEKREQIYADSTIISISQGPKSKLVNTTEGLKASPNGLLMTMRTARQQSRESSPPATWCWARELWWRRPPIPKWWRKPWMNI